MSDDAQERSRSGVPIHRYEEQERAHQPPVGEMALEEITDHLESFLGKSSGVFHELVSDLVHIDVLLFPPSAAYPFRTIATSGMSDLPMSAPEGYEDMAYAEVFMHLPADWPLDEQSFSDERYYWPIRWLKTIARFPHDYRTFISSGHTIPNGEHADPLGPGTELGCLMLAPPLTLPEEVATLEVSPEKTIHFFNLFPLYREEMKLKLDRGTEALVKLLEGADIVDVVDPSRVNVARKKRGLFGLW